jgi:hypothetical protein
MTGNIQPAAVGYRDRIPTITVQFAGESGFKTSEVRDKSTKALSRALLILSSSNRNRYRTTKPKPNDRGNSRNRRRNNDRNGGNNKNRFNIIVVIGNARITTSITAIVIAIVIVIVIAIAIAIVITTGVPLNKELLKKLFKFRIFLSSKNNRLYNTAIQNATGFL